MTEHNDSLDELNLLKEQLEIERHVTRCDAKMYQRLYEASTRALEAAKEKIALLELSHAERLEDYFRKNLRLYDKESLPNLQAEIGEWAKETFPNSTPGTIQRHLREEVGELYDALLTWEREQAPVKDSVVWPSMIEEFCDVFLLMAHLAHRRGFSLLDCIRDKFQKVQARTWEWDEKRGHYRHVPAHFEEEGG